MRRFFYETSCSSSSIKGPVCRQVSFDVASVEGSECCEWADAWWLALLMACYRPVQAYRRPDGSVVMVERGNIQASLLLPCGRCVGCRLDYAASWEVRIMHEAKCWEDNCWFTLTYDDAHVPKDGSLQYRAHFMPFMKRLRKRYAPRTIRFFCAGEYGDSLGRPHFHVVLFNFAFRNDRKYWRTTESGFRVDRSATLESLWKFGHSEIGELSPESANYVARYAVKKITGDAADEHYRSVDSETGEITWRVPELCQMSRRPGIGALWFEKFHQDVFPHDRVVSRGVRKRVPRYYDKLFKRMDPATLEDLKEGRGDRARLRFADNTPERLKVREFVESERMRYYKRGLK